MSVNLYNATTDTLKNVAGDIINPKSVNEMIAPIEDGTASKAYAVGEQFIMNDLLCEVTQAIAQGDTMVIGINCEESEQLSKQIKDIKSDLTDYSVNTPLRNVTYYNGKLYQLNLDGTIGSEIGGVKRFVGENLAEVGTSEGSALAHTIYGMSVQDGTPTPDSPVKIESAKADFRCTGKNLIPYPYYQTSQTYHGITTVDNGDGSITANGTATSSAVVFRYINNDINKDIKLEKKKYILSTGGISGGEAYHAIDIGIIDKNGSTVVINNRTANIVIDNTDGKYQYIFAASLWVANGTTLNNVTIHPMLTLADADQTYEVNQHTDVTTDLTLRAIEVSSTDDYNLERDGKYYIADTIDWSEDEGYKITRRVGTFELDGTETGWMIHGDGTTSRRFDILNTSLGIPLPITTYQKSNRFIFSTTNTGEWGTFRFSFDGYLILKDNQSVISNVDTLKTWLGTNKPRFDYILATPTTEPITSEQAQALLSLKTYDEASYISSTGSVEPSVDLEYAKSEMGAKALTGHNEAYIAQELEGVYGVKNFLDLSLSRSDLPPGITTTFTEDGGIHISGQRTDSQTSVWGLNYTIKGLKKGITYKFTCNQYDVPRVGMYYVSSNITKPTTFTWTQDGDGTFTIYIAKGVTYDVTIYPMLRLASIQSNEYQPYAMSNYELTKKIKELETALIELSSQ